MVVAVEQQPTSPNVTGTELLYVITSPSASMPQFRFVTDVYDSTNGVPGEYITTLKTYPNRYGKGVIDVARELSDVVSTIENISPYTVYASSVEQNTKTFTINFGGEWSDSITGSRQFYSSSASETLIVFPGSVDINEGSYNFNSGSFIPVENGSVVEGWYGDQALTDDPYKLTSDKAVFEWVNPTNQQPKPFKIINQNDWESISVLNGDPTNPNVYQYLQADISIYSGSTALVSNVVISGNYDFNLRQGVVDVPVGPRNFTNTFAGMPTSVSDIFNSGSDAWTHYTIGLTFAKSDSTQYESQDQYWFINDRYIGDDSLEINGWNIAQYQFNLIDGACNEPTRFNFINKYGVSDYYSIYKPVRKVTDVNRGNYSRTFTRYEQCDIYYDISNRGETQYLTQYTDRFEITTDWLDKQMADWLTQLLESPSVMVQVNGGDYNSFVPVIITNASYIRNEETSRNKLFQYVIEFAYANQRYSR